MPRTASFCQGGEESREFWVVPTSRSQIVDRSAGSEMAVREPVRTGSTSAGVAPVVATLMVDSLISEARDHIHAVADVSTTQESSSVETSQVSGITSIPVSKPQVREVQPG